MALITDADGHVNKSGSPARLRLSRLKRFGVKNEARHGYVFEADEFVHLALVGRVLAVTRHDFRFDPPIGTEYPQPIEISDADGKYAVDGAMGRLRLSRLEHYGIAEADRHGHVKQVGDDIYLTLKLTTDVCINEDDFRWD